MTTPPIATPITRKTVHAALTRLRGHEVESVVFETPELLTGLAVILTQVRDEAGASLEAYGKLRSAAIDVAARCWVDPRFRLLLILGVEGRLERQGRLSDRMLQRIEGGMLVLRSPGRDKKRASDLVLRDAQLEAIAFECNVGFLVLLMKAYHATQARIARGLPAPSGELDVHDFPLAPAGQLTQGQARAGAGSLQPANDRTMWDWNKPLLDALGIKGDETSLRAWRRLCVDLYKQWRVDPDVHRLVTGHGAVSVAGDLQRDERQDTLQSTYFDQSALHIAREAQAVM